MLAGLSGCGGSGPRVVTATPAAARAHTASRGATATAAAGASVPRIGGCAKPVQEFADDPQLVGSERAAVERLIAVLVRYPVRERCASAQITVVGRPPAGRPAARNVDLVCLGAAAYIETLVPPPARSGPPVGQHAPAVARDAPAVARAAAQAIAAIHAESPGQVVCQGA